MSLEGIACAHVAQFPACTKLVQAAMQDPGPFMVSALQRVLAGVQGSMLSLWSDWGRYRQRRIQFAAAGVTPR